MMQTLPRHDAYRVERLDVDDLPVAEIQAPVHPSIVEMVADQHGVPEDQLWEAIFEQQRDMVRDGTRISYLGQLLEDGDAVVVGFSNNAVYLRVTESTWEQEKEWLVSDSAISDSVEAVHTDELDSIHQSGGGFNDVHFSTRPEDIDLEKYPSGFCVSVDFPLATVDQHPDIDIDPYPVAERTEFLRFEAGVRGQLAQVQSLGETLDLLGIRPEQSEAVISDVMEISVDEVAKLLGELKEVRREARAEMLSMADGSGGERRIGQLDESEVLNEYAAYLSNRE